MSMADFEVACLMIGSRPDLGRFSGAKSEDLIESAERALGLRFPPTYRSFLRRFGSGSFGGSEYYGIINNDIWTQGAPNVVWMTRLLRKEDKIPNSFVPVHFPGYGTWLVLDVGAVASNGECPVLEMTLWGGLYPPTFEPSATDFGALLLEHVRNVVSGG